jgi:hypothetical protein
LLPLVERDYHPQVKSALVRLGQLASEANDELCARAEQQLDLLTRPVSGGVELTTAPLALLSDYMVRTLLQLIWRQQAWPLQDMSFDKWEQLLAICRAESPPPQSFPGGVRVNRDGSVLRLSRPSDPMAQAHRRTDTG